MTAIDRSRFLDEGYLIVEGLIPPARLAGLRRAFEALVDRQRGIWARERGPEEPPGGQWEASSQPRLILNEMGAQVDAQTAPAIEFWTQEIHRVSSSLLDLADVPVLGMMLMCNPVRDHGTADHNGWHRDVYPPFSAPIQAYVDDIVESGPRYVQWNVPLYDDDVLWVMPGSHRRLNTDEEKRCLRERPREPLPGAVQTRLRAGDGVVYITPILHWGSCYDSRKRRTIHGGFCPYIRHSDLSFLPRLTTAARRAFEGWQRQSEHMMDLTETALRKAIAGDAAAYGEVLEQMHPGRGERGRLLTSIFLSKTARRVYDLRRPDSEGVPAADLATARTLHPMTLDWGEDFSARFEPAAAAAAWWRFRDVDEMLQAETEMQPPEYADRPSHHYFYEMPPGLTPAAVAAGWNGPAAPN